MLSARTDMELASSLAEKISLLEQKIEKQAQEIQLKVKVSLLLSLLCPLPWEFHLSGLVRAQKFICGLLLITQTSSLQSNRAVGSGLGVAEGTVPAGTSCSSDSQHPGTKISSSLVSDFFFSSCGGAFPLLFSETAAAHTAESSWSSPLCITEQNKYPLKL